MKFETINNQLCRMVEPEPLTPDSQFPCVVRPIQDDSQMGKLNKRKILCGLMNCPNGIFVAKEIRGDDTSLQYTVHAPWGGAVDFEKLEIIGHPVADGSAEWALYRMMHGKWVHNPELEKHKTETTDTRCLHAYAISGDNVIVKNIVTGETSVLGTARPDNVIVYFETTGWQLYEPQPEPKPLLANAQVGDLCRRRSGSYVQIRENKPDIHTVDRFYFTDLVLSVDVSGRAIDRPTRFDIVHTEPLATEGTAEWAWQMMKMGKDIIHCEYTHGNAKWRMTNGTARNCLSGMSADTKEKWLQNAIGNGWQLYAEPARFKVGDWVKYHIDTYLRVIEASGAVRTLCKTISGTIVYPYTSCLSKIDPSEVKVKVTLEGTVRLNGEDCEHFLLKHSPGGASTTRFNALDPATCTLVKNFLKAQKEK